MYVVCSMTRSLKNTIENMEQEIEAVLKSRCCEQHIRDIFFKIDVYRERLAMYHWRLDEIENRIGFWTRVRYRRSFQVFRDAFDEMRRDCDTRLHAHQTKTCFPGLFTDLK